MNGKGEGVGRRKGRGKEEEEKGGVGWRTRKEGSATGG